MGQVGDAMLAIAAAAVLLQTTGAAPTTGSAQISGVRQTAGIAPDARRLAITTPRSIVEIDTGKLKGETARLAWSPDGSEFYIQTIERDARGNVKSARHYVVKTAAKSVTGVDVQPPWAATYWAWKSGQASPASATFRIDVSSRQDTRRATGAPTGGVLAKGGTADPLQGTTIEDVANAAIQTQQVQTYTLKLKGETLGEWINQPVLPGTNFGWAPAPLRLIAYSAHEGGPLFVLDEEGRKQQLTGAKTAILPAWSDDGAHLAWLERIDKKKLQLMVADISTQ
jgi:hypothetical protein